MFSPITLTLSADEDEDSSIKWFPDLLATRDIAKLLTRVATPSCTASLCAVSKDLFDIFADKELWASQLEQNFEMDSSTAKSYSDPKREFARRTVCSALSTRWPRNNSSATTGRNSGDTFATALSTRPPWVDQIAATGMSVNRSWSHSERPLLASPRRPLHSISRAEAATRMNRNGENRSSAAQLQRVRLSPCAVARLQSGLRAIVMSGHDTVTACPEQPGDWCLWSARVTCPRNVAACSGMTFRLALDFTPRGDGDANGATDYDASGLPHVRVVSPACFHPSVRRDGVVSAAALSRRTTPVALISEQLAAVIGLLNRPEFGVAPLNRKAAALWFGDADELRARVRAGLPKSAEQLDVTTTPARLERAASEDSSSPCSG